MGWTIRIELRVLRVDCCSKKSSAGLPVKAWATQALVDIHPVLLLPTQCFQAQRRIPVLYPTAICEHSPPSLQNPKTPKL